MLTKRLVLRLSSLGDIILSTAVLEVPHPSIQIDWAIAEEYKEMIETHPGIHRVLAFRRSLGSRGWRKFCRQAWENHYDEVIDLHKSLRTRMMRLLFIFWSILERSPQPRWKSISKQKFKLYPYFVFKSLWPKSLRPTPWVTRFTQMVGGSEKARPNLRHLIQGQELPTSLVEAKKTKGVDTYLCVMPSSRWDGKKWPVENYFELLKTVKYLPVILGSKSDPESLELVARLSNAGMDYFSGVGVWSLAQTARVLSSSVGYLGGDTGLAHLAEAVGVPAKIIFGPTAPDMGFGPWMKESESIGLSLWCRPCGKDGRACFRFTQRYRCLKDLSVTAALTKINLDSPRG